MRFVLKYSLQIDKKTAKFFEIQRLLIKGNLRIFFRQIKSYSQWKQVNWLKGTEQIACFDSFHIDFFFNIYNDTQENIFFISISIYFKLASINSSSI